MYLTRAFLILVAASLLLAACGLPSQEPAADASPTERSWSRPGAVHLLVKSTLRQPDVGSLLFAKLSEIRRTRRQRWLVRLS